MIDVNNIERMGQDFILDTGSPHLVRITDQLNDNFLSEASDVSLLPVTANSIVSIK